MGGVRYGFFFFSFSFLPLLLHKFCCSSPFLFSITIDGHSGWQTSRLLSSTLVSYVARELDLVFRGASPYLDLYHSLSSSSPLLPIDTPKSWSSFFSSSSPTSSSPTPIELDTSTEILQAALKNSFLALDSEIVNGPITLLHQLESKSGLLGGGGIGIKRPNEGGMNLEQTENLTKLLPALSGSCALLAFLDVGRNKYVFFLRVFPNPSVFLSKV